VALKFSKIGYLEKLFQAESKTSFISLSLIVGFNIFESEDFFYLDVIHFLSLAK